MTPEPVVIRALLLAGLTELKSLNLRHATVSDAGLKVVAGFTALEHLDLSEIRGVTKAGSCGQSTAPTQELQQTGHATDG